MVDKVRAAARAKLKFNNIRSTFKPLEREKTPVRRSAETEGIVIIGVDERGACGRGRQHMTMATNADGHVVVIDQAKLSRH